VTPVNKVAEGRPHIVDMIKNGEISLIVNTVEEKRAAIRDSYAIRRAALQQRVTLYTTLSGARAACNGMEHAQELRAYGVQELHARLPAAIS
jgi:carbamoyl-phosphate synthase large subunit